MKKTYTPPLTTTITIFAEGVMANSDKLFLDSTSGKKIDKSHDIYSEKMEHSEDEWE